MIYERLCSGFCVDHFCICLRWQEFLVSASFFGLVPIRRCRCTEYFVPELQTTSLRQAPCYSVLPGVVHAKVVLCYVEVFRDADMSCELFEEVCVRHRAIDTNLRDILLLVEQRTGGQNLENERTSSVSEGMDDEKEN